MTSILSHLAIMLAAICTFLQSFAAAGELKPLRIIDTEWFAAVRSIAFSSDSKQLVGTGDSALLKIWDSNSGEERKCFFDANDYYDKVAFLPGENRLAVLARSTGSTYCDIWSVKRRTRERQLKFSGGVPVLVFSLDGKTIVVGDGQHGVLLDSTSLQPVLKLKLDPPRTLIAAAFSRDGHTLATSAEIEHDKRSAIYFWDVRTGKLIRTMVGSRNVAWQLAFADEDRKLVTGGSDRDIIFWDIASGKPIKTFAAKGPFACTRDGCYLVAASFQTVDLKRVAIEAEFEVKRWSLAQAHSIALSPDETLIATGDDSGLICLWDAGVILNRDNNPPKRKTN